MLLTEFPSHLTWLYWIPLFPGIALFLKVTCNERYIGLHERLRKIFYPLNATHQKEKGKRWKHRWESLGILSTVLCALWTLFLCPWEAQRWPWSAALSADRWVEQAVTVELAWPVWHRHRGGFDTGHTEKKWRCQERVPRIRNVYLISKYFWEKILMSWIQCSLIFGTVLTVLASPF